MKTDKYVLQLAPAYNELSQLLFMLQMSYINPSVVDVEVLKIRIDSLISVIHAHNFIENSTKP